MDAIGRNYGIRKASENKIPRSSLVARVWRVQVHWVGLKYIGYLQNSLFNKNENCFSKFFTHTLYILITHEIVKSHFQRENLSKTMRVKDCHTHNHLHKILLVFFYSYISIYTSLRGS